MPSIVYSPVDTRVSPGELPRMQPAQQTDAVGEALQRLGQSGSQLADTMHHLDYQQHISDGITSIKQNLMSADEQFTQYMEQAKGQVPENGAGYTDLFADKFSDWQNAFLNQYSDPRLKKIAAEQAATLHNRFYNQASQWQIETNRAWRVNTFDDSIQHDSSLIDSDPTQYQPLLKAQLQSIDALSSQLHPTDKIALTRKANQAYAQAAALSWARSHPQDTVNAILNITPVSESATNTPQGKIVAAANQAGIDANQALAVASIENDTFDPTRKNPGSSAIGLFQMIGSTWNQAGGTDADRMDPDRQAELGVQNLASNARAFKTLMRRDPTPGELYSTQFGSRFAGALAGADDRTSAATVFERAGFPAGATVAAANGLSGMDAGQVKQHFASLMASRMAGTAGYVDQPTTPQEAAARTPDLPWLADLTPNERQAVLTHAQAQLHKDDAGEKAAMHQTLGDVEAALNVGKMPGQIPSNAEILHALGPAEGAIKVRQLDQARWYGAAVAQLNTAGPAETQQILATAKAQMGENTPGGPGFAVAQQRSAALDAAAAQVNNARLADPIGQDQQALQVTKPLDFTTPAFLTGPMAARFEQAAELQRRWNLPTYTPLSKGEAAGLSDFLARGKPSEVADYLSSLRAAAGSEHAERYSALMTQIAPKNPLMATAGAVAAYDRQTAQSIIVGSSMLKDEKVLGVMAEPKLFEEWWNTNRGQAFGQYVDNSRMNLDAVKAVYAATLPAELRNSKVLDEATMRRAANAVSPTVDYNGPTLVPPGMTQDGFVREVGARYEDAMRRGGYDPQKWPMGQMRFVPLPHADGIYQPYSGTLPVNALIDFNRPPTGSAPAFIPQVTGIEAAMSADRKARPSPTGVGTKSYYRGK